MRPAVAVAPSQMRDRWTLRKGWVISFLVGALIGPILTNYHGVQVTARSAQAE